MLGGCWFTMGFKHAWRLLVCYLVKDSRHAWSLFGASIGCNQHLCCYEAVDVSFS